MTRPARIALPIACALAGSVITSLILDEWRGVAIGGALLALLAVAVLVIEWRNDR